MADQKDDITEHDSVDEYMGCYPAAASKQREQQRHGCDAGEAEQYVTTAFAGSRC